MLRAGGYRGVCPTGYVPSHASPNERARTGSENAEQQERRITEIDGIIKRLYEDNISGKLTDERFSKMFTDYEREQADLRDSVEDFGGVWRLVNGRA